MKESKNSGFVLFYRKILEHSFYMEKRVFSKFEAWFDIVMSVNHSDNNVLIDNTLIECKRGQSVRSLGTWQKRWNWSSKSLVRSFLLLLQKMNAIRYENKTKTVRITILNYDFYQKPKNANRTHSERK